MRAAVVALFILFQMFWLGGILVGTAYIVFGLGYSGWWWLLAVFLLLLVPGRD